MTPLVLELVFVLISCTPFVFPGLFLVDSDDDINLLAAVGSPLPPDVRPVTGPFGRRGRPAVEFNPQSYVGRWAKDLLPIPFYYDFGMKVTLYLQSLNGGVLFSILESDHSRMKLGLSILRVGKDSQCVELIYRSSDPVSGERELTATFILPKFVKSWVVFSMTIRGQVVTLFFNGCDKIYSKVFQVKRAPLRILPTDPLFVGMAGWYIEKPSFFGALYDLTIYKDVSKAVPLCVKEKQAEYELVNFQENTRDVTRHEEETDGTDTSVDRTTANIIAGLKRIQTDTDPSSGKRKGGSLINPFQEETVAVDNDAAANTNEAAKKKVTTENNGGDSFNPFAENNDNSDETKKLATKIVGNESSDDDSKESEVFNPFMEKDDSSNDDTDKTASGVNGVNVDANSKETKEEEEEEFNPFKDTHAGDGDVPNPFNGQNSEEQAGGEATATLPLPTKAAKILTTQYSHILPVTTAAPATQNIKPTEKRAISAAVTLARVRTRSAQKLINNLKTKTKSLGLSSSQEDGGMKKDNIDVNPPTRRSSSPPTTRKATQSNKRQDLNKPSARETQSPNYNMEYSRSNDLQVRTMVTQQPYINRNSSNEFLRDSLKKTVMNKLITLMDGQRMHGQRTTTSANERIASQILPTEQIIKLARTHLLSKNKFKELLPKITYSPRRTLKRTTTLPVVARKTVRTTKASTRLPKTEKMTTTTRTTTTTTTSTTTTTAATTTALPTTTTPPTTVMKTNKRVPMTTNRNKVREIPPKTTARNSLDDVITKMPASAPMQGITQNEKSASNRKLPNEKVNEEINETEEGKGNVREVEKLEGMRKLSTPPTTTASMLRQQLRKEMNRIDESINTISRKSANEYRLPTTDGRIVVNTPEHPRDAVDELSRDTSTPVRPITVGPVMKTQRKPKKSVGDLLGPGFKNDVILTLDDITRLVIDKLKTETHNNDLLRDEERIKKITQKVLDELKSSGNNAGESGVVFIKGEKGERGESIRGPQGRTGLPGVIGLRGPRGERGKRGPHGLSGEDGRPGLTGLKGARGERGPPGPPGVAGVNIIAPNEARQGERQFIREDDNRGERLKKRIRDADLGLNLEAQGPHTGAKALIIYTMQDLFIMTEMFPIGQFVFVTSSSELYLRGVNGWMQIPTVLVSDSAAGYLSAPVAHKIQAQIAQPSPLPIDRLLIEGYLVLPPAGVKIARPYLLMAALNMPYSGQSAGTIGADYMCMKQANAIGLDGSTFRAFLSSDFIAIKYIVESRLSNLPVANFKGEMLFRSIRSIFNTSGYAAFNPKIPIYSFDLKDVRLDPKWPIKKIWHGSHANGEVNQRQLNCDNWRTKSPDFKATAASILTYTPALNEEVVQCDNELIVLCIQSKLT